MYTLEYSKQRACPTVCWSCQHLAPLFPKFSNFETTEDNLCPYQDNKNFEARETYTISRVSPTNQLRQLFSNIFHGNALNKCIFCIHVYVPKYLPLLYWMYSFLKIFILVYFKIAFDMLSFYNDHLHYTNLCFLRMKHHKILKFWRKYSLQDH